MRLYGRPRKLFIRIGQCAERSPVGSLPRPSTDDQRPIVHTRDHCIGPCIPGDSRPNGQGKRSRDDPGSCHNTCYSIEIKDDAGKTVIFTAADWTDDEKLAAVAQVMRLAGLPDTGCFTEAAKPKGR